MKWNHGIMESWNHGIFKKIVTSKKNIGYYYNKNNMVNFTLTGLNQAFTLDTSGVLAGEAPAEFLDVSAVAVYNIKLSDMQNVFKFQTDSFDVNNVDASDIKYYVFSENPNWPTNLVINPANADMSHNAMFATGGEIVANRNKVKHDFVRYLAYKLFNTAHGVDLFSNETQLLADLVTKGATAHTAIKTALAAVNTTASDLSANVDVDGRFYATNTKPENTTNNFSRELLRQIAHAAPQRFHGISDISGVQSIPLAVNDSINFKVSISSYPAQHTLTSRASAFDIRVYQIKLILKEDVFFDNGGGVVVPIESDNGSAYPYHS